MAYLRPIEKQWVNQCLFKIQGILHSSQRQHQCIFTTPLPLTTTLYLVFTLHFSSYENYCWLLLSDLEFEKCAMWIKTLIAPTCSCSSKCARSCPLSRWRRGICLSRLTDRWCSLSEESETGTRSWPAYSGKRSNGETYLSQSVSLFWV